MDVEWWRWGVNVAWRQASFRLDLRKGFCGICCITWERMMGKPGAPVLHTLILLDW